MTGLLATSILASLFFSCSYGILRTVKEFNLTLREVAFRWLIPPMRLLTLLGGFALCLYYAAHNLSAKGQLVIYVADLAILAPVLLARYGLTAELRREILLRIPAKFGRLAALIFREDQNSTDTSLR